MNLQKLVNLEKKRRAKSKEEENENQNEETSFIKKENKTLITPRSRRSKSRNKETEVDNESEDVLSDHIDKSNDDLRQPSTSSIKGLIRKEQEIDETQGTKRAKKKKKLYKKPNDDNEHIRHEHVNEAYESDTKEDKNELELPKRGRRRGKKSEKETDEKPKEDTKDLTILAVIVHQTDKLRTDINMYHPIVRVHIVDLDMGGQYVKNVNKRNVLMYYEKEYIKRDYIAPIMTTPYDFKVNRSIIPKWEEIIVFNEDFNYFLQEKPNCLILFEIIDSAKSADSIKNLNSKYTSQDTSNSWQRIAWAFLKVVGVNKTPNVEKKIRLQLYYSQIQYKMQLSESLVPEVYNLYKMGPRIKYPASLHVTIKSIQPPNSFEPGIRSVYLLNENNNKLIENENTDNENQTDLDDAKAAVKIPSVNGSKISLNEHNAKANQIKIQPEKAMWLRVPNLPCRVPNDLDLKLNTAKYGCYSVKFSNLGNYLACACVEDNNASPVLIYEIPSGKLIFKYQGHFGIIYEFGWSQLDKYVVTASNDATARVLDIENRSKEPYKILPHPSFLYTAKFHPNSIEIICTSGYDKVIRIWSISSVSKNQKYGQLLQEMYGHNGFVNTTCFSADGSILYSADSNGKILIWNCNSTSGSKEKFKEWTIKHEIEIDELKDRCINHIKLHPNQFRMIVHLRDNEIKLIDLRLEAIIKTYKSSFNFTQNVKSALTPCGSFIFSSGVDTKIFCWNLDSGEQIATENISLNYLKPARDIDFHPFDNLIVFCSFDSYSPVYVYRYNPDKATRDINELSTVYSQANLSAIENRIKLQQRTLDATNDFYILPNQTDIQINDANEMQKKFNQDIEKFNSYQANRWKNLQQKLDSVHPTQNLLLNSGRIYPEKQVVSSSITLTMPERPNDKPEFKYKGPKEVEDLVVVLYDYSAQRSDELDLKKGDEILVLVRENENWWMGELAKTKQQGYFPASYVQEKGNFDSTNVKFKLPKFTVKDAMVEMQKEYDTKRNSKFETAAIIDNNIAGTKPAETQNTIEMRKLKPSIRTVRNRPETGEKVRSALTNQTVSEDAYETTQDENKFSINEIDEIPTKEKSYLKSRTVSKRRLHSHIIIGEPQTSSEI